VLVTVAVTITVIVMVAVTVARALCSSVVKGVKMTPKFHPQSGKTVNIVLSLGIKNGANPT
jgi:hypothetical protein